VNQRTTTTITNSAQLLSEPGTSDFAWDVAVEQFGQSGTYWLATIDRSNTPHVRPVLAVVAHGTAYFCCNERTQKGINLHRQPACSLSTSVPGFDFVVQGVAERTEDTSALELVASIYDQKYGWQVNVRDGAFNDVDGAPTAGPPPYLLYRIIPKLAFAFGTEEQTTQSSTRWSFRA
jgi:hypothetical protein